LFFFTLRCHRRPTQAPGGSSAGGSSALGGGSGGGHAASGGLSDKARTLCSDIDQPITGWLESASRVELLQYVRKLRSDGSFKAAKRARDYLKDTKQRSLLAFFQAKDPMSRVLPISKGKEPLKATPVRTIRRRVETLCGTLIDLCQDVDEQVQVVDALCTKFFGQRMDGRISEEEHADLVIRSAIVDSMVRYVHEQFQEGLVRSGGKVGRLPNDLRDRVYHIVAVVLGSGTSNRKAADILEVSRALVARVKTQQKELDGALFTTPKPKYDALRMLTPRQCHLAEQFWRDGGGNQLIARESEVTKDTAPNPLVKGERRRIHWIFESDMRAMYRAYTAFLIGDSEKKLELRVIEEDSATAMDTTTGALKKFGCPGPCGKAFAKKPALRQHQRKKGCGVESGALMPHVTPTTLTAHQRAVAEHDANYAPISISKFRLIQPFYCKFAGRDLCTCGMCTQALFFCEAWYADRKALILSNKFDLCDCSPQDAPVTLKQMLALLLCDRNSGEDYKFACISGRCTAGACGIQQFTGGTHCGDASILCCENETEKVDFWGAGISNIARGKRVKFLCEKDVEAGTRTVTVSVIRPRDDGGGGKTTDFEPETLGVADFFNLMFNHIDRWIRHYDHATYTDSNTAELTTQMSSNFHQVIVGMDYAQNGSFKPKVECQGKMWIGNTQVTIFPTVIIGHVNMFTDLDPAFRDELIQFRRANNLPPTYTRAVVFITDDNGHDVPQVLHFLSILFKKYFKNVDIGSKCNCGPRCMAPGHPCQCAGGKNPTCSPICHMSCDNCGNQFHNWWYLWWISQSDADRDCWVRLHACFKGPGHGKAVSDFYNGFPFILFFFSLLPFILLSTACCSAVQLVPLPENMSQLFQP
jgi:transposase